MKLAVVIPTYNEAQNIPVLLQKLRAVIGDEMRIYIVDDASPDGTARVADELGGSALTVIRRPEKIGLGSAYREGFAQALADGAEAVAQMDADLSHDPAALPSLLASLDAADLAIGSRHVLGGRVEGWGPWRHFCSRSAIAFARLMLGLHPRDVTSGYRIWRAPLLREVLSQNIASNGYAFQEEMLYRAQSLGGRITEVAIVFQDRKHGRSKLRGRDVMEFFRVMIRLRFGK